VAAGSPGEYDRVLVEDLGNGPAGGNIDELVGASKARAAVTAAVAASGQQMGAGCDTGLVPQDGKL